MSELTNKEIAAILSELADLLEINGENKFKVRAYSNASRTIMSTSYNIKKLAEEDRLTEINGIGKGIASTIKETIENGFCPILEEIKDELPTGVLELINIPGLGPKRAHQLYYELGIQDIDQLREALTAGKVRKLKGFGSKTEEKLLSAVDEYQQYQEVYILYKAMLQSEKIIASLKDHKDIEKIEAAGSIRRRKELIGDIDILVQSSKNNVVMDYFTGLTEVKKIIVKGTKKTSVMTKDNYQVDLRVVNAEEYLAALQYFTGSKEHNVILRQYAKKQGYKLNEYGLFDGEKKISLEKEADIYENLKLDYIIPEMREGRGEIEAAKNSNLPSSVSLSDIRGDLHMHSHYSDGAYSIEEMVEAARERNYKYIAITDHSQSLRVAHGMTPEKLLEQMEVINDIQSYYDDIKILKGIEVDIDSEGNLDYKDEILEKLDLVIASVHTGFNMAKKEMTNRIIKAIENKHVNIIGHPQGRILKKRKAYPVDIKKVIKAAAEHNTALEINASPYRLDLDDLSVKFARDNGVRIAINTDSHHTRELDDMMLGITVARRGWLEKGDIINTFDYDQLISFLGGS